MTRDELLAEHRSLSDRARQLMELKNRDYGTSSDPFRNFRWFGRAGILVRLSDKLARLRTFEERGLLNVRSESVEDTVLDILNYAVLYFGMYIEECSPAVDNPPESR